MKRWILLGVVMPLVSMSKPMVFASHSDSIHDLQGTAQLCYVDTINITLKLMNEKRKSWGNPDDERMKRMYQVHLKDLNKGAHCLALASDDGVEQIPSVVINTKVYKTGDVDWALQQSREL